MLLTKITNILNSVVEINGLTKHASEYFHGIFFSHAKNVSRDKYNIALQCQTLSSCCFKRISPAAVFSQNINT